MDARTLNACLDFLVGSLADVFTLSRDFVPRVRYNGRTLVVACNTSDSTDAEGSHWVLFITELVGTQLNTTFYDSFSLDSTKYNIDYPYKINKHYRIINQSTSSSMCGFLCVYYVFSRFSRHPTRRLTKDTVRNEYLALELFRKIRKRISREGHFDCKYFGCYPIGQEPSQSPYKSNNERTKMDRRR